ncbi:MBL fold metallo-hydrolase [Pseudomonas sp. GL-R-19]|uniref:MBL fold metallo-hydrolase n=1 Tax=Pseudomonas sp. GL-R-19 TaxID=2832391 RepID=UPI001CBEC927|nr:MBL fold metallo-hydrolase [Pseudomonas sp. GL-R-19]
MNIKQRRATVRIYRHGLGDCHLVTLYGKEGATYRILIDCGVIIGTSDATKMMTDVLEDVRKESGDNIDLLVATHKHWDHLSGFMQAKNAFSKLNVSEVWMAWTEDPDDKQASELRKDNDEALAMLQSAAMRLQMDAPDIEHPLLELLGFFGASARITTQSALEAVRNKSSNVRYCDPEDKPHDLKSFGAKIYVLGPPRDEARLRNMNAPKTPGDKTTYKMALDAFNQYLTPAINEDESHLPFSRPYNIPTQVAQTVPFFQEHYWNQQDWRRIDDAWLDDATSLALQLDNVVNNTSLVLGIELNEGDVLLFAADAQVGNWLSWGDRKWTDQNGTEVTGPDLLHRTVFYKVGHHGSPNATGRECGIDLMVNLAIAVVPVDHEMALKRKWGDLPFKTLMDALDQATKTRGYTLRTDQPPSNISLSRGLRSDPLYFEIDF